MDKSKNLGEAHSADHNRTPGKYTLFPTLSYEIERAITERWILNDQLKVRTNMPILCKHCELSGPNIITHIIPFARGAFPKILVQRTTYELVGKGLVLSGSCDAKFPSMSREVIQKHSWKKAQCKRHEAWPYEAAR